MKLHFKVERPKYYFLGKCTQTIFVLSTSLVKKNADTSLSCISSVYISAYIYTVYIINIHSNTHIMQTKTLFWMQLIATNHLTALYI